MIEYPDSPQGIPATALDSDPASHIGQLVFSSVQALYQSRNNPVNRQIADRLAVLYQDALDASESILDDSLCQFTGFFLTQSGLGLPKITLTPDSTLRVRWIQGERNFSAIEFTGRGVTKLVAEIPREHGVTARYSVTDSIDKIMAAAHAYLPSRAC